MNINNITSRLVLIIAMAFLLCGCGRSDTCIEADDFGFAKAAISSRYDESDIFGNQTAEITPWIDAGLILDGNPLYIEVKNYDSNPNDNVSGILSAWCPWYGDKDHGSTLTDYCVRLNPCHITSLCPSPAVISLPITNAPCLMTKGMGLYALLTVKTPERYDANLSIDTMSNPDPNKSVSLHMGNPQDGYEIPSMNNDGTISSAGGVLYNYENVGKPSSYTGGTLYFKILDSFYEDNNGQYRVFIKSGVRNGGWDPISWCISLVQTALFGTGFSKTNLNYSGVENGVIPSIYAAVVANSGFISAVQALLTLYIMFSAMGFLMGSLELTQKELIGRLFKVIIITILIGPHSWYFFNQHIFVWFYEGTGFVIGILYEVAASGPGSTNPLDFFFSEEMFIKLSSLLLATPTGWIFITVYIIMMVFLIQVYFDAAVLYMTSLIMMGVLICIAPIFITLFLFEQTKSFFDNWLKQIMAYSIQMILVYAGILFMTMIIRNQIYNTLGFATCAIEFPNIGGITIFEWYFPKILSWSSNPELANIPIPKDHFESAEQAQAQAAAAAVAAANVALAQAQANQQSATQLASYQQALTQARADQAAANQNVTYAQAQFNYTQALNAYNTAEAQVQSDQAALTQAQADQTTVSEVGVDLNNFNTGHATESFAALQVAVTGAQSIVSNYLGLQAAAATGAANATIAKITADQSALAAAQSTYGSNYIQNDAAAQNAAMQIAQAKVVAAQSQLYIDIAPLVLPNPPTASSTPIANDISSLPGAISNLESLQAALTAAQASGNGVAIAQANLMAAQIQLNTVNTAIANFIASTTSIVGNDLASINAAQTALAQAQASGNSVAAAQAAVTTAQTQLQSDITSQLTGPTSSQAQAYNALTSQTRRDFAAYASAKSSGQGLAAAQSELVADITSQQSYANTIMQTAVANAQTQLAADIAIAQDANAAAQTAKNVLTQLASVGTADAAANTSAQAQAAQQVANAQAALNAAQANVAAGSESPAQAQAAAAEAVAAAQSALDQAQALQTSINTSIGTVASSATGGFGFTSSSSPSAQDNTFCLAYQCIGERYPDLPFLDPNDPFESKLINQMRNGQIGDFGSIAIIVVCVYLMDHFNKTTVSMSKFLSNTQGNQGDSSKAAASAAGAISAGIKSGVKGAADRLGISGAIKAQRESIDKFFAGAKYKLIDKPWADHKIASLRADAANGGLKSVRQEAERLTQMSHADATEFNRNLKNLSYNKDFENLLKTPTSADGIGKNNVDARIATNSILSKLRAGKAEDFKNIAAAELFARDAEYAALKGKVDYGKLSAADAAKVDKLSGNLKVMLDAKAKQDAFADAYVESYKKMSEEDLGLLRKSSSTARDVYGLSAVGSGMASLKDGCDGKRADEAALSKARKISDFKKDVKGSFIPESFKEVDYAKLYGDRAKDAQKAKEATAAEAEKLSNKDIIQRTGSGDNDAKEKPFNELEKERVARAKLSRAKLTAQEKEEADKALAARGFTDELAAKINVTKNPLIARSGPGGQGVSHPDPFNGAELTPEIRADLLKQGFTEENLSHMTMTQSPATASETALGVVPGGVQVQGTLHIQIEMGPKFAGTMEVNVGSGMHIVDTTQGDGSAHEPKSAHDKLKDMLDEKPAHEAPNKPTPSAGGRSGGEDEHKAEPVEEKESGSRGPAKKEADDVSVVPDEKKDVTQSSKRAGTKEQ